MEEQPAPPNNKEIFWTKSKVLQLIKLYEENPCLYNTTLQLYKKKGARTQTLQSMAMELGTTAEEVTRKIRGMRSQFSREKAKVLKWEENCRGGDLDQAGGSLWPFYQRLLFLDNFTILRKHRSNMELSFEESSIEKSPYTVHENNFTESYDDNFHYDITASPQIDLEPNGESPLQEDSPMDKYTAAIDWSMAANQNEAASHQQVRSLKRRMNEDNGRTPKFICRKDEEYERVEEKRNEKYERVEEKRNEKYERVEERRNEKYERVEEKGEDLHQSFDSEVIFGKYVASELSQITNIHKRRMVKHKIQTIIYEAHFAG